MAKKAKLTEGGTVRFVTKKPTKSPRTVPGGRKPKKKSRGQGRP